MEGVDEHLSSTTRIRCGTRWHAGVAARGTGAAADDARGWVPQQQVAWRGLTAVETGYDAT
jgi:hypothetical protein